MTSAANLEKDGFDRQHAHRSCLCTHDECRDLPDAVEIWCMRCKEQTKICGDSAHPWLIISPVDTGLEATLCGEASRLPVVSARPPHTCAICASQIKARVRDSKLTRRAHRACYNPLLRQQRFCVASLGKDESETPPCQAPYALNLYRHPKRGTHLGWLSNARTLKLPPARQSTQTVTKFTIIPLRSR